MTWTLSGDPKVYRGKFEPADGSGHTAGAEFRDKQSASHILTVPVTAPSLQPGQQVTIDGVHYTVVEPIKRRPTTGDKVGLSKSGKKTQWGNPT